MVERGIGQLKRRFHVLHGEIRVNPGKTTQIVMVCAALHNLCKERNLELPEEEDVRDDQPDEVIPIQARPPGRFQNGLRFRDHFVNLHFQ